MRETMIVLLIAVISILAGIQHENKAKMAEMQNQLDEDAGAISRAMKALNEWDCLATTNMQMAVDYKRERDSLQDLLHGKQAFFPKNVRIPSAVVNDLSTGRYTFTNNQFWYARLDSTFFIIDSLKVNQ